jgi:pSer/pThr/pTyr-binding forkhead associated (FHA) protein
MSLSDLIERLGKTIFEAPFDAARAPKDAPELAEIRLAVLEQILKKGQRAAGKIVFPYNLVRIHILGASEDESAFLKSDFLRGYFEQEIRKSLSRSNYRFPDDLEVEFDASEQLPATGEEWLRVETESRPRKEPAATVSPRESARLVVVRGTATAPEIGLNKERTNIGRTVEVYRAQGPSRRNDLAFTEENDINCSVSREHAHILYSKKTGEYRLYNDRWYRQDKKEASTCGLWIIRDGLSQEVHRNARGVKLQPNDEIQLGRAIVKFQVT